MFDRILVATDGSEGSKSAFAQAVDIARVSNCEIFILNVVLTSEAHWGYAPHGLVDEDRLKEIGFQTIEDTIKGIDYSGIKLTKKVRLGSPEYGILAEASIEEADLIIMGSKGIGLLAATFLGSTSERILKTALCPVLIVKDPETIKKLKVNSIEEYYANAKKKEN